MSMKSVEKNNNRSNQQHGPSGKETLDATPSNSQHGETSLKKKKRKPVKNVRHNEEDVMTLSDIQQGFLGYMTHHRWGKESSSGTMTLNDMTPLCRQWVTKLSPILDMFDFDCQDIFNLVESCDYDESRIQASVDLIFKERGGHERGEWKVGRKRGGVAQKSNQLSKNSTSPATHHNKPVRTGNTNASEKKHYAHSKNKNHSKKENNMDYKTNVTTNTITSQSKENTSQSMIGPRQAAPTQMAPTQIAPSQAGSTTTKPSETPQQLTKEVPSKPVSWASILVEKLAGEKVKQCDVPQEQLEIKESLACVAGGAAVGLKQTTPVVKLTMKDGYNQKEVKCGQLTTPNTEESTSHHMKNCVPLTTLPGAHNHSRKTIKPFVRSNGVYTTIDERTKKSEPKSFDANLLSNSTGSGDLETNSNIRKETLPFEPPCLQKEVPPGLSALTTCDIEGLTKDVTESCTNRSVYESKESHASTFIQPRTESTALKEGLDFYLGSVSRGVPQPALNEKPGKPHERLNEINAAAPINKHENRSLNLDALNYYQEKNFYDSGQRPIYYSSQTMMHTMSMKEPNVLSASGTQPTLMYSHNGNNNMSYLRDNNRRLSEYPLDMVPMGNMYDSSSVYHPGQPSYPAPFRFQQHRAGNVSGMSRYPLQYHPCNNPGSQTADYYPYAVDTSILKNKPTHYQMDPKRTNISYYPYRYNNTGQGFIDVRPPSTRPAASSTSGISGNPKESNTSDIQRLSYDGYRQACSHPGVSVYTGNTVGVPSLVGYQESAQSQPTVCPLSADTRELGPAQEAYKWRSQGNLVFDSPVVQGPHPGYQRKNQYDHHVVSYDKSSLYYKQPQQASVIVGSSKTSHGNGFEANDISNEYLRSNVHPQNFAPLPISNYLVEHSPLMQQQQQQQPHNVSGNTSVRNQFIGLVPNTMESSNAYPMYRNQSATYHYNEINTAPNPLAGGPAHS